MNMYGRRTYHASSSVQKYRPICIIRRLPTDTEKRAIFKDHASRGFISPALESVVASYKIAAKVFLEPPKVSRMSQLQHKLNNPIQKTLRRQRPPQPKPPRPFTQILQEHKEEQIRKKLEEERKERERLNQERQEKLRQEKESLEQARAEKRQLQQEQREQQKREQEELQQRQKQEKLDRQQKEQEKQEQERLQRLEQQRQEQEQREQRWQQQQQREQERREQQQQFMLRQQQEKERRSASPQQPQHLLYQQGGDIHEPQNQQQQQQQQWQQQAIPQQAERGGVEQQHSSQQQQERERREYEQQQQRLLRQQEEKERREEQRKQFLLQQQQEKERREQQRQQQLLQQQQEREKREQERQQKLLQQQQERERQELERQQEKEKQEQMRQQQLLQQRQEKERWSTPQMQPQHTLQQQEQRKPEEQQQLTHQHQVKEIYRQQQQQQQQQQQPKQYQQERQTFAHIHQQQQQQPQQQLQPLHQEQQQQQHDPQQQRILMEQQEKARREEQQQQLLLQQQQEKERREHEQQQQLLLRQQEREKWEQERKQQLLQQQQERERREQERQLEKKKREEERQQRLLQQQQEREKREQERQQQRLLEQQEREKREQERRQKLLEQQQERERQQQERQQQLLQQQKEREERIREQQRILQQKKEEEELARQQQQLLEKQQQQQQLLEKQQQELMYQQQQQQNERKIPLESQQPQIVQRRPYGQQPHQEQQQHQEQIQRQNEQLSQQQAYQQPPSHQSTYTRSMQHASPRSQHAVTNESLSSQSDRGVQSSGTSKESSPASTRSSDLSYSSMDSRHIVKDHHSPGRSVGAPSLVDHTDAGGPTQNRRSDVMDRNQSMPGREVYDVSKRIGLKSDENNNNPVILADIQIHNQKHAPGDTRYNQPTVIDAGRSNLIQKDAPTLVSYQTPISRLDQTLKETVPDVLKQVTVQRVTEVNQPVQVPDVINETPMTRSGHDAQKNLSTRDISETSPTERLMQKVYHPSLRLSRRSAGESIDTESKNNDVRDFSDKPGLRPSPPEETAKQTMRSTGSSPQEQRETSMRYSITRESVLRRVTPERVTHQDQNKESSLPGSPAEKHSTPETRESVSPIASRYSPYRRSEIQSTTTVAHGDVMPEHKPENIEPDRGLSSGFRDSRLRREPISKSSTVSSNVPQNETDVHGDVRNQPVQPARSPIGRYERTTLSSTDRFGQRGIVQNEPQIQKEQVEAQPMSSRYSPGGIQSNRLSPDRSTQEPVISEETRQEVAHRPSYRGVGRQEPGTRTSLAHSSIQNGLTGRESTPPLESPAEVSPVDRFSYRGRVTREPVHQTRASAIARQENLPNEPGPGDRSPGSPALSPYQPVSQASPGTTRVHSASLRKDTSIDDDVFESAKSPTRSAGQTPQKGGTGDKRDPSTPIHVNVDDDVRSTARSHRPRMITRSNTWSPIDASGRVTIVRSPTKPRPSSRPTSWSVSREDDWRSLLRSGNRDRDGLRSAPMSPNRSFDSWRSPLPSPHGGRYSDSWRSSPPMSPSRMSDSWWSPSMSPRRLSDSWQSEPWRPSPPPSPSRSRRAATRFTDRMPNPLRSPPKTPPSFRKKMSHRSTSSVSGSPTSPFYRDSVTNPSYSDPTNRRYGSVSSSSSSRRPEYGSPGGSPQTTRRQISSEEFIDQNVDNTCARILADIFKLDKSGGLSPPAGRGADDGRTSGGAVRKSRTRTINDIPDDLCKYLVKSVLKERKGIVEQLDEDEAKRKEEERIRRRNELAGVIGREDEYQWPYTDDDLRAAAGDPAKLIDEPTLKKRRNTRDFIRHINTPLPVNAPVLWTLDTNADAAAIYSNKKTCIVGTAEGTVTYFDLNGNTKKILQLPFPVGSILDDGEFMYAWCPNKYGFQQWKGALYDITDSHATKLMYHVEDIGEALLFASMHDGMLLLGDDKGSVFMLNGEGNVVWKKEHEDFGRMLKTDDSGIYLGHKRKVYKLSFTDGSIIWEWEATGRFAAISNGVIYGQNIYVEVSGGVLELDSVSGSLKREFIPARHRASGVCIGNGMLITGSCPTVIFNLENGEEEYRMNFAGRLGDAHLKLHDGGKLVAAWDKIYCIDLSPEGIQRAKDGRSIRTLEMTTAGATVLHPPEVIEVTTHPAPGVIVECRERNGKVEVNPVSPDYNTTWSVNFPNSLLTPGVKYIVDKLVQSSRYPIYRVMGDIKELVPEGTIITDNASDVNGQNEETPTGGDVTSEAAPDQAAST